VVVPRAVVRATRCGLIAEGVRISPDDHPRVGSRHDAAENSSTGNLMDLSPCKIDEYVTSSLGTGTQNWPPPWTNSVTYPIPTPPKSEGEGWLATDGFDSDYQLPGTFSKPYVANSFTETQIYHFSCPGYKNGNWVTLAGPYTITRSVSQTNGVWQYKVTKADGSLTYNLP
jgi:hypothetical protein